VKVIDSALQIYLAFNAKFSQMRSQSDENTANNRRSIDRNATEREWKKKVRGRHVAGTILWFVARATLRLVPGRPRPMIYF